MARVTADKMAKNTENGLKGYEAIWQHILNHKGKTFSVHDIEIHTNVDKETVRDHIKRFMRGGYIEQVENNLIKNNIYRLCNPVKIAPRLNRKGAESTQGLGREQMWRTMKMLGIFSKHDLAVHASTTSIQVKVTTAEDYIKFLNRAGYLVQIKKSKGKCPAEYRFLTSKNTGYKAPMIQRVKNVYDPNLKKVVWTNDKESAA